jgi:CRISPR/Cas system-associated protein Csm6
MSSSKPDFVVVSTVQSELAANVIKSYLESEGIPVLLKSESAGSVFGLTVDGLG